MRIVLSVAGKAVLGEDRADIAVEIDLARGVSGKGRRRRNQYGNNRARRLQ
jgi:hypothetical protein